MNSTYLAGLIDAYGASEKTMLKVRDVFMQGDSRYADPEHEVIVAGFMDNGAMSVSETHVTQKPIKNSRIRGPQKGLKTIAKALLEERGYKITLVERAFQGNIPDILAEGRDTLAVECGPCAIRKAIDYLEAGAVLWILKPIVPGHILYEFKRSENWNPAIKSHRDRRLKEAERAIGSVRF